MSFLAKCLRRSKREFANGAGRGEPEESSTGGHPPLAGPILKSDLPGGPAHVLERGQVRAYGSKSLSIETVEHQCLARRFRLLLAGLDHQLTAFVFENRNRVRGRQAISRGICVEA